MNAKELIAVMQKQVAVAKEQNIEYFTLDQIEKWINNDLKPLAETEVDKEHYYKVTVPAWVEDLKSKYAENLEHIKGNLAERVELVKGVFQFGGSALKSAILINGGAAVAILAFIGKIYTPSSPIVKNLACPLMMFVYGVLVSAMATGAAYITQSCYAYLHNTAGNIGRVASVILVFAAYILFGLGAYYTGQILTQ